MALVLVSHGCYCRYFEPSENGQISLDPCFSGSISNLGLLKYDLLAMKISPATKSFRLNAQVRARGFEKLCANGNASKMVSTKELMRSKIALTRNSESAKDPARALNGSKRAVNGASLVKTEVTSSIVKMQKKQLDDDPPSMDELNVFPSDKNFSWAKENYNAWQRTIEIWSFVLSLGIRILFDNAKWSYPYGFTENKQRNRRHRTASWCRVKILQLGPTFIKLGQLSSTRSDLFPREFVDELAKLQDRVPASSPEKAKALIENELGLPVQVLFKRFEDQPIAAASLGQVHRAILYNGEKVAVKVQRSGLKRLFDIDLGNLKLIAEYFQKSDTFGRASRDWVGIYEECSKILYQEINYINEGQNADRFRRDFRNIKWVRVPTILWDYTSVKVLTMEYVPGTKIYNLVQINDSGRDRALIASRIIEAYLIQILKTGFFHADPHPGNLAVDKDGSIIYYDFGMMGDIQSFTRERLLDLLYAVYEKNANKVMRSLIELEALRPTGDLSSVRRSIKFFLDNLLSQKPDQQQTLAAIGEDLFAIATDQPFRFPTTFTFVIRAFSTLEGIGYTLDPEFSFVKVAAPYAQELLDMQLRQRTGTELVNEIGRQANDARNYTISMPYRIQKIEEFVKQLESGDLKLRVRVLESERAAQKANILQMAAIYTALGGTLLNVGVTLSVQGNQTIANGSFFGAGFFLVLLTRSMQRVKKLEKFEKML